MQEVLDFRRPPVSRLIACLGIATFLASACGGSPQSSSPIAPTPTGPFPAPSSEGIQVIYTSLNTPVVARVVSPDGTEVIYFGTKTASGLPQSISSVIVHAEDPTRRVTVIYDTDGRPTRLLGGQGEETFIEWAEGTPKATPFGVRLEPHECEHLDTAIQPMCVAAASGQAALRAACASGSSAVTLCAADDVFDDGCFLRSPIFKRCLNWEDDPGLPEWWRDLYGSYHITGRVIDAGTRLPVRSALLSLSGPDRWFRPDWLSSTDENGVFSIYSVPEESYELKASSLNNYRSQTRFFVLNSDRVVDFALEKLSAVSVSGISVSPSSEGTAGVTTFSFAAQGASSSTERPLSYQYDFGDGTSTAVGNPVSHVFKDADTYIVRLTVTDTAGVAATASRPIVVRPRASVSVSGIGISPAGEGVVGETTFTFTAVGASSSAGRPLGFAYDFGDGTPITVANPATHVFARAGTFTVRLTVSDGGGESATATGHVTVRETAPDPPNPPSPRRLTGTFTGPILMTFLGCTRTHLETGTATMNVTVDGSAVSGTVDLQVVSRVTSGDCTGGPQTGNVQTLDYGGVRVTGTTASLRFNATATVSTTEPDGVVLTTTRGFAFEGALNGNTLTGTVIESFQNSRVDDRGQGSATFALILR